MTIEEFEALPIGTVVELRNGKHRYCRVMAGYQAVDGISEQVHSKKTFLILFRIDALRVVSSLELLAEAGSEEK